LKFLALLGFYKDVAPTALASTRGRAVLGGEGAINRFCRRGDADAMDEVGGHEFFNHGYSNFK
jgi:hypothetical protein